MTITHQKYYVFFAQERTL